MEYKSSFGVRAVFVEFAEIAFLALSVFSTINSKSFLIMETEVEVKDTKTDFDCGNQTWSCDISN